MSVRVESESVCVNKWLSVSETERKRLEHTTQRGRELNTQQRGK